MSVMPPWRRWKRFWKYVFIKDMYFSSLISCNTYMLNDMSNLIWKHLVLRSPNNKLSPYINQYKKCTDYGWYLRHLICAFLWFAPPLAMAQKLDLRPRVAQMGANAGVFFFCLTICEIVKNAYFGHRRYSTRRTQQVIGGTCKSQLSRVKTLQYCTFKL